MGTHQLRSLGLHHVPTPFSIHRLTASLLRQATYTNARFGLYLSIKDHLADQNGTRLVFFRVLSHTAAVYLSQLTCECIGNLPPLQKIVAGMLAGAGGSLVGNPADVIMVRMQADGTCHTL